MAGVLGIYGLITAVIINGKLDPPDTYSQSAGPFVKQPPPRSCSCVDRNGGILVSWPS